jgi:hypothetical protein
LADKSLTGTPGRSSPHSLGLFTLDRIAAASPNRCTTALQQRRWGECKSAREGEDKYFYFADGGWDFTVRAVG